MKLLLLALLSLSLLIQGSVFDPAMKSNEIDLSEGNSCATSNTLYWRSAKGLTSFEYVDCQSVVWTKVVDNSGNFWEMQTCLCQSIGDFDTFLSDSSNECWCYIGQNGYKAFQSGQGSAFSTTYWEGDTITVCLESNGDITFRKNEDAPVVAFAGTIAVRNSSYVAISMSSKDSTVCIVPFDCQYLNNCSSNGLCNSNFTCDCDYGYSGDDCSIPDCASLNNCTFGTCVAYNTCACDDGYLGDDCSVANCTSVDNCSDYGDCVAPDTCVCDEGYYGDNCALFNCTGVNNCTNNGECVAPDTCQCDGYVSDDCSIPDCSDLNNCSDNGNCIAPSTCECYGGLSGNCAIDPESTPEQDPISSEPLDEESLDEESTTVDEKEIESNINFSTAVSVVFLLSILNFL